MWYEVNTFFPTEIAVSPNNNVVNIYEKKAKDWVKIHELSEHSGRITGTIQETTTVKLPQLVHVVTLMVGDSRICDSKGLVRQTEEQKNDNLTNNQVKEYFADLTLN